MDMLADLERKSGPRSHIIAIDPVDSRRSKMEAVYNTLDHNGKSSGQFVVTSIEGGKETVAELTGGLGCNAVLEVTI